MATSSAFYFDRHSEDLAIGVVNFNEQTYKAYLSNQAPAPTNMFKGDIVEIDMTNEPNHGPAQGGADVQASVSRTGSTSNVNVVSPYEFGAVGGNVGPFRYVVLYDETSVGNPLVMWWDHGSAITLTPGDTFRVTHNQNRVEQITLSS